MSFTIAGETGQELYRILDEQYMKEFHHFQNQAVAIETLHTTFSVENRNLKNSSSSTTTQIDATAKAALSKLKKEHHQYRKLYLDFKTTSERAHTLKKYLNDGIEKFTLHSLSNRTLQTLEFLNPELLKKTEKFSLVAKNNLKTLKEYFDNMDAICQRFEDGLTAALDDFLYFDYYVTATDNALNGAPSGFLSQVAYYLSESLPEAFAEEETERSVDTPPSTSSSSSSSSAPSKKIAPNLNPICMPKGPQARRISSDAKAKTLLSHLAIECTVTCLFAMATIGVTADLDAQD